MNKIVVVVNPLAGGGRAGEVWEAIRSDAPELADAHVVRARETEEARQELLALLDDGVERLVVLGGDGSIHLLGNFLLQQGKAQQIPLGLVPVGTGSDLARTLGLPTDPHAALRRVLGAQA